MIKQPYGIIYVTGPTGSGKTTTLYSLLNEINSREIKITTVEDPIEYDLPGLCQVQTHANIGLGFRPRPSSVPPPGPGCDPGRRDA